MISVTSLLCLHIYRVGQNCIYTPCFGKKPSNRQSNTVYIYGSGHPYTLKKISHPSMRHVCMPMVLTIAYWRCQACSSISSEECLFRPELTGAVNRRHTLVKQRAQSALTFANGPHAQACCTTAMSAAAAVCVCGYVGATVPPQIDPQRTCPGVDTAELRVIGNFHSSSDLSLRAPGECCLCSWVVLGCFPNIPCVQPKNWEGIWQRCQKDSFGWQI